jgi:hypothetical protein
MLWRLPDGQRTRYGVVVAMLVAACLSKTSASSAAEPTAREKARALLAEGARLLQAGDAAGALSHFQAAQATYPNPKNLSELRRSLRRALTRPVPSTERARTDPWSVGEVGVIDFRALSGRHGSGRS